MPREGKTKFGYSPSSLLVYMVLKYILQANSKKGATYDGLSSVLGYSKPGLYLAVKKAEESGLVTVIKTGKGPGAKNIIYPAVELSWED